MFIQLKRHNSYKYHIKCATMILVFVKKTIYKPQIVETKRRNPSPPKSLLIPIWSRDYPLL